MICSPPRRDQFARCADGDNLAVVHNSDAIAQPFRFIHVVGGEQDGAIRRSEGMDDLPELSSGLRVESGCRFIQEQQFRIAYQGARDRKSLFLSAGEFADERTHFFFERYSADGLLGRQTGGIKAAEKRDGFANGEFVGELSFLQRDTDSAANAGIIPPPAQPENFDLTEVASSRPSRISMVVVLPAPLGPRRPNRRPRY